MGPGNPRSRLHKGTQLPSAKSLGDEKLEPRAKVVFLKFLEYSNI